MKEYIKYVFYVVLLGALFFIGRYSKPDTDLIGWEKEKKTILKEEQTKRDSLYVIITDQTEDITLLEEKDSLHIVEIEGYQKKDIEQDKELKMVYNELHKLGSTELTKYMITEYEKYN